MRFNLDGAETMFAFLRTTRLLPPAAIAGALLLGAASGADAQTTGAVRFQVAKAGFIFGVGGGTGTLRFRGKTYPLRVEGLSAGTIGVAQADLVGTASNLRDATDIVGSYSAAGAGIAIAGGAKSMQLQNAKGVILNLHGRQAGFEASLGVGGATITMQ
jgi:hypothetical protein